MFTHLVSPEQPGHPLGVVTPPTLLFGPHGKFGAIFPPLKTRNGGSERPGGLSKITQLRSCRCKSCFETFLPCLHGWPHPATEKRFVDQQPGRPLGVVTNAEPGPAAQHNGQVIPWAP